MFFLKVHRVLNIWKEREVFEGKFIDEVTSTLDGTQSKSDAEIDNFQPTQLCTQLKIMKALQVEKHITYEKS